MIHTPAAVGILRPGIPGLILLLAVIAIGIPCAPARPVFGVLGDTRWVNDPHGCPGCPNTDRPQRLHEEGIRNVEIRVPWSEYEIAPAVYSPEKIKFLKDRVAMLERNGLKAVLNIEWHRYPEWIWQIPDSSYVGAAGIRSGDLDRRSRGRRPNIVFNQNVRDHLIGVIRSLAKELGPQHFFSVRISNGGIQGELAFPDAKEDTLWAYDANAGAAGESVRPATIPRRPFGDWRPGYPATAEQMEQWYRWYVDALADAAEFQIIAFKQAGFSGPFQVMMPGKGARPSAVAKSLSALSAGEPMPNELVSMGVAWHMVARAIQDKDQVSLHCSSVAEENPVDLTKPGDARDPMDKANWPFIDGLGASRWIAVIADHYGFLKSGENPGKGDANGGYYYGDMAANAIAQAAAAGFVSFDWAHHENLWSRHRLLDDKLAPAIKRSGAGN